MHVNESDLRLKCRKPAAGAGAAVVVVVAVNNGKSELYGFSHCRVVHIDFLDWRQPVWLKQKQTSCSSLLISPSTVWIKGPGAFFVTIYCNAKCIAKMHSCKMKGDCSLDVRNGLRHYCNRKCTAGLYMLWFTEIIHYLSLFPMRGKQLDAVPVAQWLKH